MKEQTFEYVVAGAGVSGVYIAWRLALSGMIKPSSIVVCEKNDWVGGRLYSQKLPGIENDLKAEMGGLCFPTSHVMVANLIKHLGINTCTFTPDWRGNLYYLRGRLFNVEDILSSRSIPFNFKENECNKTHKSLVSEALEKAIPGLSYFSRSQWENLKKTFKIDGVNLYNISFWQLMKAHLSNEAYQYIQECYCYDSTIENWNASAAISWYLLGFPSSLDFPDGIQLNLVKGGYQSLPLTLMDQAKALGVQFRRSEVKGFDINPYQDDLIQVDLLESEARHSSILCKNLILAMPRCSLESICFPKENFIGIKNLLESVTPQPVFRVFLMYKSSWWKHLTKNFSKMFSDTLIREIYYWDAGKDNSCANYGYLPSIMLNILEPVSKQDETYTAYMSILSKFKHKPIVNSFSDLDNCKDVDVLNLINLVQQELADIHNLRNIPRPDLCVYANWTDDVFGGMWHTWNTGVKYWQIMGEVRKPYKDQNVFIYTK
jgi:lysine 2-monooxygenase